MIEFKGVVNLNAKGEVVCFCSEQEVLRGKCLCKDRDDCPDAIICIEVIPGSRPSEQSVKKVEKTVQKITKETNKIKEGLAQLEKAIKNTKFRL